MYQLLFLDSVDKREEVKVDKVLNTDKVWFISFVAELRTYELCWRQQEHILPNHPTQSWRVARQNGC